MTLNVNFENMVNGAFSLLYGFIKYEDVFSGKDKSLRETFICYKCALNAIDLVVDKTVEWGPAGPPGANRYT